jgi:hypothetical protein
LALRKCAKSLYGSVSAPADMKRTRHVPGAGPAAVDSAKVLKARRKLLPFVVEAGTGYSTLFEEKTEASCGQRSSTR